MAPLLKMDNQHPNKQGWVESPTQPELEDVATQEQGQQVLPKTEPAPAVSQSELPVREISAANSESSKSVEVNSSKQGDKICTPADTPEDTEVPAVLYRLDYRDYTGNLLFRKENSEPIDAESAARLHWVKNGVPRKPVIEILTEITAQVKRERKNGQNGDGFNDAPGPPGAQDNDADYRYPDDDNGTFNVSKVGQTYMIIHSSHLINALRDVIKYYPGKNLLGTKLTIDEPYQILVHHRKDLEEYKTTHPASHPEEYIKEANEHIDILLKFLDKTLGPQLKLEEERHKRDPPVCTYEHIWFLFKPGEDVYWHLPNTATPRRPMVVCKVDARDGRYDITSWNLRFDGLRITPRSWSTSVMPFDGEKPIDSLPIYPIKYHKEDPDMYDGMTLKEHLTKLGKLYWKLSKDSQSYMDYNGKILAGDDKHINGRVIIDVAAWKRFSKLAPPPSQQANLPPPVNQRLPPGQQQPGPPGRRGQSPQLPQLPDFMSTSSACSCIYCRNIPNRKRKGDDPFKEYQSLDPKDETAPQPSDHIFFVCTRTVEGYILSERKWAYFDVSGLSTPTMTADSFDYLVLEDHIKSTVKSLVWKFGIRNASVTPWSADLIKGKGEGQIFLLHGAPGVGKTCTAECVAELTQRPLLSLTCGDMGVTPLEVEQNLGQFLKLGELWGAIVLLDEADIYLEQRDTENLQRNALVSVFLRALEYYKGILFLTTNRVGSFDEAFISRIHVPLYYKDLTDDDRRQIWENSFERLEGDKTRLKPIEIPNSTSSFAAEGIDVKWNGREIRNALQTAVALAEYDSHQKDSKVVRLEKRHLDQVVRMSKSFKAYLKETHGKDMSKKAKDEQIRADGFGKKKSRAQVSDD